MTLARGQRDQINSRIEGIGRASHRFNRDAWTAKGICCVDLNPRCIGNQGRAFTLRIRHAHLPVTLKAAVTVVDEKIVNHAGDAEVVCSADGVYARWQ